MKVSIEKNELVVRIPMLSKPRPSSSGKTMVVATTGGNQKTGCDLKGFGEIVLGLNAYVKPSSNGDEKEEE